MITAPREEPTPTADPAHWEVDQPEPTGKTDAE